MSLLSIILFVGLILIAIIHLAWAFGIVWPAKDEQSLINMVVGVKEFKTMPSFSVTTFVALCIFSAAFLALWGGKLITLPLPQWALLTSLIVLASIFGLRGFLSYLPLPFIQNRTEPFLTLDRWFYAPLCLLISFGYFTLYYWQYYTHPKPHLMAIEVSHKPYPLVFQNRRRIF